MSLSRRSIEAILDLIDNKLSYMTIIDKEDAQEHAILEKCQSELQTLLLRQHNVSTSFELHAKERKRS